MSATAVEIRPPVWRRLIGFNAITGVILGIIGYYLGWFLGHHITGKSIAFFADIDQNDLSVLLGYFFGVCGFLIKRNIITIFMSIELMLNAVNLAFVTFANHWHQVSGQIFVFFVMVVAAAEAAVGLAIIISLFRSRNTLNVDQIDLMKL